MLRFVLCFGLAMGAFELFTATPLMRKTIFPSYLRFNAEFSASLLRLVEKDVAVHGQTISGRYALTIERGCDAIEPSALFLSGVLAFPVFMLRKIPGMLIGTFCLMAINIVRIISLYYIGVFFPKAFHIMHVDVWQAVFIFLAILFWILWALWALRVRSRRPDAAAKTH